MGAYYSYVKIPQCGYMEHGFKDIAHYVYKRIYVPLAVCYNFPLIRDKPLGASAFMRLVYSLSFHVNRPCHSRDVAFSKFDLENLGQRSWMRSRLKVPKWVRLPIDSHPFVPCQSAIPFLGYGHFKIWPCISINVITHGHTVGPISYRLTSFSSWVNRSSHSWDVAVSKFDLENPRSRSWVRWKSRSHN